MQAAQDWFDNVQTNQIEAYELLFNTLLDLGNPHIQGLEKADIDATLACIADKSGQFRSKVDQCTVYVSKEDDTIQKKPVAVSQEARKSISEYYQEAKDLCDAQSVFMQKTRKMQGLLKDKNSFLDIIRQVQLPAVQVMVRTRSEEEALQGKTYQELSLAQHLPNYKKLQLSVTDQTRTMATFIYFVLYKQLTGKAKSQQGCSEEIKCKTTPFKCSVTRNKQPDRPGRGKGEGESYLKIEEIKQQETGGSTAKKPKVTPKPGCRRRDRSK